MSGKGIRIVAWFGPAAMFAIALGAILYLQPYQPAITMPYIPQWQFSADFSESPALLHAARSGVIVNDPFKKEVKAQEKQEKLPVLNMTMVVRVGTRWLCRINGALYGINERGPDFVVEYIGKRYADVRFDNGQVKRIYMSEASGGQSDGTRGDNEAI